MSNPSLQTFALFANSNQAVVKTTEKGVVSIPFQSNLADHDPHKMFKMALSMVKYTNSVYNITTDRNTLQMAVEFAPGRGFVAGDPGMWQTWTIRVPPGAYDIVELSNLLSEGRYVYTPEDAPSPYANRAGYEVVLQPFMYANIPANMPQEPGNGGDSTTTANCFVGFGAIPLDATDPIITKAALSIDNNSKLVFQSPDVGHMIQYGTDIVTACVNKLNTAGPAPYNVVSDLTLDHSFVYKGVYLIFNTETAPLLKLLGFFNIESFPPPTIVGYRNNANNIQAVSGYGLTFVADTLYRQYPNPNNLGAVFDPVTDRYAADNTTFYILIANEVPQGIAEIVPALPTFDAFSGHFGDDTILGSPSPFFNVLFQPNSTNTGYLGPNLGYTMSGVGIVPPNPLVLSKQPFPFRAICSRDILNVDNVRWNYDVTALATSLLLTEIGIWGTADAFPVSNPALMPVGVPNSLQLGYAISFYGDGLGNAVYLSNVGAPAALTTNLYNKIIKTMGWRSVQSGPAGGVADQAHWIFCMELTDDPQPTAAVALPDRMNTLYGLDVNNILNWLTPLPGATMSQYNLTMQYTQYTVNTPQLVQSIDPLIAYTNMIATNFGLNDLSSVLIPKNLTNLEGLDEIHVHCAQLRTKHLSSTSFQPLAPSDVIGVVPVDVPFGSKGTWQPPVPLDSYISNTNIVSLDFRLTDSSNRTLDFNGLDWSMVFKCEEVEVLQPLELGGTVNTPFQDQLAAMEGTAQAQTRAMRKRGGAHVLPHEFYDANVEPKRTGYSQMGYSQKY
jgi:hypothetical protein